MREMVCLLQIIIGFYDFGRNAALKRLDSRLNQMCIRDRRISELNAEYAMLLERKKSSYAEYRKTKSEMQDWLVGVFSANLLL